MKLSKKTKRASIFFGTAVIIIVLLGIFLPGLLKPSVAEIIYPDDHLYVEGTYLLKTDETNETVSVICTPYLTNTWDKESEDIKIIVYVVQMSNNVAEYKNTLEFGKIEPDSTVELEVPIVLSENTYRIDMLIFEDGKLVLEGSLTLKTKQVFVYNTTSGVSDQFWSMENDYKGFNRVAHD